MNYLMMYDQFIILSIYVILYFNLGRMAYLQANVLSAYVFLAPAIVAGWLHLVLCNRLLEHLVE